MQFADIRRPSSIRQLRSASYAATKICKIRFHLRSRGILNAVLPGHNSARLQNAYPNFALSDARVSAALLTDASVTWIYDQALAGNDETFMLRQKDAWKSTTQQSIRQIRRILHL